MILVRVGAPAARGIGEVETERPGDQGQASCAARAQLGDQAGDLFARLLFHAPLPSNVHLMVTTNRMFRNPLFTALIRAILAAAMLYVAVPSARADEYEGAIQRCTDLLPE